MYFFYKKHLTKSAGSGIMVNSAVRSQRRPRTARPIKKSLSALCIHPTSLGVPDAPRMLPHIYIPQSRTSACGGGTLSGSLTAAACALGSSLASFPHLMYLLYIRFLILSSTFLKFFYFFLVPHTRGATTFSTKATSSFRQVMETSM